VSVGAAAEIAGGVGLLGRGLGLITRRPRLFLLGAIPPMVTSALFVTALVLLYLHGDALVAALTPFAENWSSGLARTVRVVAGLALFVGAVVVMVITFTTLTLALGAPLYDLISEFVDRELPDPPPARDEPWSTSLGRALRQSAALIAVSALLAVLLFAAGFVPLVGQVVVPLVSALAGGWLLAVELVGSALERRQVLTLRGRRELLAARRLRVLGLCVPTFLLLAIPFAAIVVFPVATAAGTLLARQLVGEATRPATGSGRPSAR